MCIRQAHYLDTAVVTNLRGMIYHTWLAEIYFEFNPDIILDYGQILRYVALQCFHMKHVLELRLPELLLVLIFLPRIILIADISQAHHVVNHYPSMHDKVLRRKGEGKQ